MTVLPPAVTAFPQLVSCSRLVGQGFCDALVAALAETLGVSTVLLSRLVPGQPGRVRTVSAWSGGALVPAFEYDLEGSPCGTALLGGTCHFADDVADLFPADAMLGEMGARGYVGVPIFRDEGPAIGVLAVVSDGPLVLSPIILSMLEIFASRAGAELAREESTSRSEYLGRLVEGSVSEIYVFDALTMRFVLVNKGARENLGYTMAELESLTPLDLKPSMTAEAFQQLTEPLRSGRETIVSFRTEHRRKDGSLYPVVVKLQQISDLGASVFFAAIEDITIRAAAETKLRETQERLQRLFAQSPAGIVEADATGRMTLVNKTWCNMLGYSEDELLERTVFDVTHPDSMAQTAETISRIMGGEQGFVVEKQYVHKSGRAIDAMINVSALRGCDGQFLGIAAVVADITERRRAEEVLRESEARLRRILDGTLAFVGVMKPDGTLLEANAAALAVAGIAREDVIGKKFWDCYWWAHDRAVIDRLKAAVAKAAAGKVARYDELIRVKDDARITIDFLLTPSMAEDGTVELLVPSGVDITERKRQETILKALMREVNHRSKNLLSVVQAIARQMPETSPQNFKREFELRLRSLAACQDIVVESGWQSVPLGALINSQLTHFADLLGKRITVEGAELKISPATSQALGMAVYELTTNAIKYGSLSDDHGAVDIRWHVDSSNGAPLFRFSWHEHGGPRIAEPKRAGFGSTVLRHLVPGMLNGECHSTYAPEGFIWRLECPLAELQQQ